MVSPGPESQSSGEDENLIVIPINRDFSDGTQNSWPKDPKFRMVDDTVYRQKLAVRWAEEMGAYEKGMDAYYFLTVVINDGGDLCRFR